LHEILSLWGAGPRGCRSWFGLRRLTWTTALILKAMKEKTSDDCTNIDTCIIFDTSMGFFDPQALMRGCQAARKAPPDSGQAGV
jgi:hypothetical protein